MLLEINAREIGDGLMRSASEVKFSRHHRNVYIRLRGEAKWHARRRGGIIGRNNQHAHSSRPNRIIVLGGIFARPRLSAGAAA